jgi:hypothetical protein
MLYIIFLVVLTASERLIANRDSRHAMQNKPSCCPDPPVRRRPNAACYLVTTGM